MVSSEADTYYGAKMKCQVTVDPCLPRVPRVSSEGLSGRSMDLGMVPLISSDLTLVISVKQGSQTQRPIGARRSPNKLRDPGVSPCPTPI